MLGYEILTRCGACGVRVQYGVAEFKSVADGCQYCHPPEPSGCALSCTCSEHWALSNEETHEDEQ